MSSEWVVYLLFFIILLVNLSFIFGSKLWVQFQLYSLKAEQEWLGKIPFFHKMINRETKFAKSKRGPWLFRTIGIVWLIITTYMLVSFLIEIKS